MLRSEQGMFVRNNVKKNNVVLQSVTKTKMYSSFNLTVYARTARVLRFVTELHTFTRSLVRVSSPQYTAPETQPFCHSTSSTTTHSYLKNT